MGGGARTYVVCAYRQCCHRPALLHELLLSLVGGAWGRHVGVGDCLGLLVWGTGRGGGGGGGRGSAGDPWGRCLTARLTIARQPAGDSQCHKTSPLSPFPCLSLTLPLPLPVPLSHSPSFFLSPSSTSPFLHFAPPSSTSPSYLALSHSLSPPPPPPHLMATLVHTTYSTCWENGLRNENAFMASHTHFCLLLRNWYWTVGMGV